MAILDFKMAKELSESIVIWMAVINCTSNLGFIHFTIFFITFLSVQKCLKMAILGLKMTILGHFWFQNGHGALWKYFYLNGNEKLY